MKFYRGSAGAARSYVEVDRGRADDYYLAEGTGLAARYAAGADGAVRQLPAMAGDGYEAWVGGADPVTGELRGRVRSDDRALRFCEVVVNGPKSWSIAAELHEDIAVAYGGAQDRAAEQIVGWLGANATARVGPRGGQVSTPVDQVEAAVVRHFTSRAGDPHRHLHVQVNARVLAGGGWRGIDTVAVRDSIRAVAGIGHGAVVGDPAFRAALAAHGFTVDPASGEVVELAGFVEPFSKRAEQIATQVAGYEQQWGAENPGGVAGPVLRRAWDARAWAEQRPSKGTVEPDRVAHGRWLAELDALGYQPPVGPVELVGLVVGRVDRDAAAVEVLAWVAAGRSAFNAADLRGEAEQLLARQGVVAEAGVRAGLAEDITARAAGRMVAVPGLEDRAAQMPAHIRAWTSPETVLVEADLAGRLAGRGAADAVAGQDASVEEVAAAAAVAGVGLDAGQAEACAALAGGSALVVVTGAAGAGKTTLLATTRAALEGQGRQLLVVTPTLRAARGARAETGARTGSAAWLAYQHGWRWDTAGRWSRLAVGQEDPQTGKTYRGPGEGAQLRPGDLLVVDEAGMLDQDTARALLTVADEQRVRVGLVGDPRQLAAVGRGGVLDIAGRWAQRSCTLGVVHRFTRTVEIEPGVFADVEDTGYADLSLRIRDGDGDAAAAAVGGRGGVFEELTGRGQVHLHPDLHDLHAAVAVRAAEGRRAGQSVAVSVATNEQAAVLNAAVRGQLVATGHVHDEQVATARGGQRVGVGDLIACRANDRDLDVANRDTFTVRDVGADGSLTVAPTGSGGGGDSGRAGAGVGERVLPAGYVSAHVQLGYAGTIHAVQGETAHSGVLVLDEHTGAAGAYVGMTRGRTSNDVHLVAASLEEAREQWVAAAGRGRPDLGLEPARVAAERAADQYAPTPTGQPAVEAAEVGLGRVLDGLRAGWTEQADAAEQLARLGPRVEVAEKAAARTGPAALLLSAQQASMAAARADAQTAADAAGVARAELERAAAAELTGLRQRWEAQLPGVGEAARAVAAGPGRLGLGRGKVRDAQQHVDEWSADWRPVLGRLPASLAQPGVLAGGWHDDRVQTAMREEAAELAAGRSPGQVQVIRAADAAHRRAQSVAEVYQQAAARAHRDPDRALAAQLPQLTDQDNSARGQLQAAARRLAELTADPAAAAQADPGGWLAAARGRWETDRGALPAQRWRETAARADPRLLDDPAWPHLAAALDRAEAAGYDVRGGLAGLIEVPLPDRNTARSLEFRLADACPASTPPPADRPPAPQPTRPDRHELDRPMPYTRRPDRGPSRGFGR